MSRWSAALAELVLAATGRAPERRRFGPVQAPMGIVVALLLAAMGVGGSSIANAQTTCPQGVSTPADGCQGYGAGGSVQHANFFTGYANQSGQQYAVRPPWNVAGVDYGVGVPKAVFAAVSQNYVTANNYPAHGQCTYMPASWPSGSANAVPNKYPLLYCNDTDPTHTITISGYDFGPSSQSTHCVMLEIGFTNAAKVIIDSNIFYNEYAVNVNTGCNTTTEVGAPVFGATQIKINGTGDVWFSRNTLSGQGPDNTPAVWQMQSDGQYGATGLYASVAVNDYRTAGASIIQYNAFLYANGRFWGYAYPIGDITQSWNYIEGMVMGNFGGSPTTLTSYTQAHGEFSEQGVTNNPTIPGPWSYNLTTVYNTCLQPSTVYKDAIGDGTTACFYESTGSYGYNGTAGAPSVTMASVTLTNNTMVTNFNPHQCAPPYSGSACMANGTLSNSFWNYRAPTGMAGAMVAYDAYGGINVANNFVDPTGSFMCFSYSNTPVFEGPLTWSGNTDLLDGSSVAVWDGVYGYAGRTGNAVCHGASR